VSTPTRRVPAPLWGILNLPFGATSGFVSVMLGFILKKQGMSDSVIASLVAINLLPHTWKVLWAPIADSTLTRKRWYVLANGASCATILGLAFVPITTGNLGIIEVLVFVNSLAITLVGMAVEGLMAHATPPDQRGRAAGWFQAGNVGGAGLGGGLGLMLAEDVSTTFAFCVIAAVLASCTLVLALVPEAPRIAEDSTAKAEHKPHWFARIVEVFREVWGMLKTRRGLTAIALVFLPIGSAAAQGLFSGELASSWMKDLTDGERANVVALTSGWLAGIAATIGCLLGGWMSDKAGRRMAYMLSGLILAVIAGAMTIFPKGATTFALFTLLYQFGGGIAYGTFTGFVLEVIGTGAAATKYNALASLSNIPILYMTKVNGWASTDHGPATMLLVDAGSNIAGIAVFLLVVAIVRPDKEKVPGTEDKPELPKAKVVS
jgi:MFS transporter, PAT family, beta-lactamase induction signal transducer AmpG